MLTCEESFAFDALINRVVIKVKRLESENVPFAEMRILIGRRQRYLIKKFIYFRGTLAGETQSGEMTLMGIDCIQVMEEEEFIEVCRVA